LGGLNQLFNFDLSNVQHVEAVNAWVKLVTLPERMFNPNYERHPIEKELFVPRVYG